MCHVVKFGDRGCMRESYRQASRGVPARGSRAGWVGGTAGDGGDWCAGGSPARGRAGSLLNLRGRRGWGRIDGDERVLLLDQRGNQLVGIGEAAARERRVELVGQLGGVEVR